MTRNEAAERLRAQLLTARRPTEWMDTAENRLDAALAHERQQGREEVIARLQEQRDRINEVRNLLDAIASPSEEPIHEND